MGRRLDLPLAELTRPGWFSSAVYKQNAAGSWLFRGYTEPKWRASFKEHVDSIMGLPLGVHVQSWRWFNGEWYPL